MRILLLGGNGQVGWELESLLAPLGDVLAPARRELDLTDFASIPRSVRELRPELIVNAAACTSVDRAETEPDVAMAVNGIAPGILAEEAKRIGAGLVHYSTDYVFDGRKTAPYTEDDKPNPLNAYGRSKHAGDLAIEAVLGAYLILRTGWIYGLRRQNFLTVIRRQADSGKEIRVVDDQVGCPTWCRTLAKGTTDIFRSIQGPGGAFVERLAERRGTYHYSGTGQTSWFGFARAIIETDPGRTAGRTRDVIPIRSDGFSRLAIRPAYSVLSTRRIQSAFQVSLESWRDQLDACWRTLPERQG